VIQTRRALNRALLARQHLLARADLPVYAAVEHLFGLQAQAPMPPYYALWTRLAAFDPEELSRLLAERRVVRATAMRGTIHLLAAPDLALIRPQLQPILDRLLVGNRPTTRSLDVASVAAAGADLLDVAPMTLKDLGAALVRRWPDHPAGTLATTVSFREPLVQVPPRGLWGRSGPPAFTTARAWLGAPLPATSDPADLVLRYLAAYGPASVRDVQSWSGLTGLGPVLADLRPKLVTFRGESGGELFDLPDAPRPDPDIPAPPRLLADFDTILLGHADRTRIVSDEYRRRVFTINGIIRSTFTVDGFVHGMWRLSRTSGRAAVSFTPFARVPAAARRALTAEAQRLLAFAAPGVADTAVTFDE
jgi:winged helix DNA-binding protein